MIVMLNRRYRFWVGPGATRTGTVLAIEDGMVWVRFSNGELDWEREDTICGGA